MKTIICIIALLTSSCSMSVNGVRLTKPISKAEQLNKITKHRYITKKDIEILTFSFVAGYYVGGEILKIKH